jgi:hypothetical protein
MSKPRHGEDYRDRLPSGTILGIWIWLSRIWYSMRIGQSSFIARAFFVINMVLTSDKQDSSTSY